MQNESKHQSPYRGLWVLILALIIPPVACYALVNAALAQFSPWSAAVDEITARVFGFGSGFLYHLSCIFAGVLTPGWQAVKYRIGEFIENLAISLGYAFASYWDDIRMDGVNFIISFIIILANLYIVLDALRDFFVILPVL